VWLQCDACDDGTADLCDACASGFYAQPAPLVTQCRGTCPPGFHTDDGRRSCRSCSTDCVTCTSFTECLQCNNNAYLIDDGCVTACPLGFFEETVPNNNTCQACAEEVCPPDRVALLSARAVRA
jgi:proprotein convertase subtilisin/kexin type 5